MTLRILQHPFPILIWRDILPEHEYDQLEKEWPSRTHFRESTSPRGKWDLRGEQYAEVLSPAWMDFIEDDRPLLTREALNALGATDLLGRPNYGRFMERAPGYVLDRHLDLPHYTATFLFYLPLPSQIDLSGAGTVIYPPKGDTFEIPYTPNTLVAFPNSKDAWHGVTVPSGENRRLYQWHLSTKETNLGL